MTDKSAHIVPFRADGKLVEFDLGAGANGLRTALQQVRERGTADEVQAAAAAARALMPLVTEGVTIWTMIALDTTGSMLEDLPHICNALPRLLRSLSEGQVVKTNLRLALVTFRDLTLGEPMTMFPEWMAADQLAEVLLTLNPGGGGGHDKETPLEAVMALLDDQTVLSHRNWFAGDANPPALPPLDKLSKKVFLLITDERAWEAQDNPGGGWQPTLTRKQVRQRLTDLQFLVGLAVEKDRLTQHEKFWKELICQGDIMVDIRGNLRGLQALFETTIPKVVDDIATETVEEATRLLLPKNAGPSNHGSGPINL